MLSLRELPLPGPFDVPAGTDYWRAEFTPDAAAEWIALPHCLVPLELWVNPTQSLLCVAYEINLGVYRVAIEAPWQFRLDVIMRPAILRPAAVLGRVMHNERGEMKLRIAPDVPMS